ncbi:hypothetical protein DFJ63DRAFT_241973 [Scheffersomyces coipomensis]|uniref:uncharacterized protein n=1 Tax=Scheffersomyces coipomensis TaxID=1788519 RepID=UPI00315D2790
MQGRRVIPESPRNGGFSFYPSSSKRSNQTDTILPPPAPKRRQPTGAELLFHQLPDTQAQETQTIVNAESTRVEVSQTLTNSTMVNSESIESPVIISSQYDQRQPPSAVQDNHDDGPLFHNGNGSSHRSRSEIDRDDLLCQKVSMKALLDNDFLTNGYNKEKYYEVDVFIKGMMPIQPFIIKPYQRTVKLAPFKLVLEDVRSDRTMFVEFNQQSDILRFLNLNETEEIFHKMDEINKHICRILHKYDDGKGEVRSIKLIKAMHKFNNNGFIYPYWTSATTIDDLFPE